jgi:hypothetical protein
MAAPHYNERTYRNARSWLTAHPETQCWFDGCTARATTIDHVPAIAEHTHRTGTNCCQLLPACRPHNCGHGASMGNRMREPHTTW